MTCFGQGHLHGLVVVVADGHEHCRAIKTDHGGKPTRQRRTGAEQSQGDEGDALLAHNQQQEYDGEGKKSRHLAQTLQHADLRAGERRPVDSEIIDQGLPGGETQGHGAGHHEQQHLGAPP